MTLIKFLSLVSLLAVVEALNVEDIVYAGEACEWLFELFYAGLIVGAVPLIW